MSNRELILLSPYRLPTQSTLYLGDDDVSAFLNGLTALWHPAAAWGAAGPPRIDSQYDHEQPTPGHLYAVPESPPLMLPDDWDQRVRDAGAIAFRATPDRARTLANLRDALASLGESAPPPNLLELAGDSLGPFFGIGLGYHMVETLFEAMSHENMLQTADLWTAVQEAIRSVGGEDADAPRRQLQDAANLLQSAREVLYPVSVFLVDVYLLPEHRLDAAWPAAFDRRQPINFVASAEQLERLSRERPERLAELRERCESDLAEVCGGWYHEREEPFRPLESQLWNVLHGQTVYRELLGQEVRVGARQRFGYHPHTPLILQSAGITRSILLAFDDAVLPTHRATVVNWPSPDGKQLEAFARTPLPADSPQTYFHLAHHLHQTIMQDQSATLALLHREKPAAPWYDDWLELARFGPVLGRWTNLSNYFNEVMAGDYAQAGTPDDFHGDYLVDRTGTGEPPADGSPPRVATPRPISGFGRFARARRQLDIAWTLAGLYRGLGGTLPELDGARFDAALAQLEHHVECDPEPPELELAQAVDHAARALAQRLVARGPANSPGYLVLNPCSFIRRVPLELEGLPGPPAVGGPVKAAQQDGTITRVVVETPALGFAWFPRPTASSTVAPGKIRMADERCVRNEFFEAEIDPATGGLRSIRDHRTRYPRIGQQLVFHPGSTMRLRSVRTTCTGPALGEIIAEGVLVDSQDEELATFSQRYRAWLGRPVLDLRIELRPVRPPQGYPWHVYYAARFAWREEQAVLVRGGQGIGYVTGHIRPESPDFLDLRIGRHSTTLYPGGLPFHQRQGGRMVDILLLAENEMEQVFDLAIGLDRDYPMQTAHGLISPSPVIETTQGPPHIGSSGWLFHLDAPQLVMSAFRPAADADGVFVRMMECSGQGGFAELRCARNPVRASIVDARGQTQYDATISGDAALLDVPRHDLLQVWIDFS